MIRLTQTIGNHAIDVETDEGPAVAARCSS